MAGTATAGDGSDTPERGERLEELLVECLHRAETAGPDAVDEFCRQHPNEADELRRQLALLADLDLFDGAHTPAAAELPVASVGDFRLLRPIGEGAMGVVYLAEQMSLRRLVALKILRTTGGPPGAAVRFEREALAIARLHHPNIVTLHAAGQDRGRRYLAMALVPGRGLDEMLAEATQRGERLPVLRVVEWGRDIARALAAAHAAGIAHRDVKPSNVRITPEGRAMLLDFGLARDLDFPSLTRTGEFQGSPHYASPEQVGGDGTAIGPATDIYSLGVTLYEAATGALPFAGETIEQVFQRILTHEPRPARAVDPAVPRDLETVLLHAMEKLPRARYPSAAALADDLDAILGLRPIAARRSRWLARLHKHVRRHPVATAISGTTTLAAAGLAGILLAQAAAARANTRAAARTALAEAKQRLDALHQSRAALADAEHRVATLQNSLEYNWLTPAEDAQLDREQAAVERGRREREIALVQVLALLQRAEDRDPGNAQARRLRAELYAEKFDEASNALDAGLAAFYRDLVLATEPGGRAAQAMVARTEVVFSTDPPGAAVHLFRFRVDADLREGGEPRLVPVPVAGPHPAVPPGTWCLRVVRGAGSVRAGDLILAVEGRPIRGSMFRRSDEVGGSVPELLVAADGRPVVDEYDAAANGLLGVTPAWLAERGGAAATLWQDGAVRTATLPAGLRVRATATPLPLSPATLVGSTPTPPLLLEPGSYLAVLHREGFEDLRYPFMVRKGGTERFEITLLPAGTTPDGFVYVPPLRASWASAPFWLQEREVTCAEYLEFVNDPAVREAIAASPEAIRVPRAERTPLWPRSATGEYVLGTGWAADWPVLAISWHDAQAFARWRTDRAAAAGSPFVFALPTFDEWKCAGHGADGRDFVFGWVFRPKWVKSNYSRPRTGPEPVLRFPIDESVFGAFDQSGSALEWLDDWYIDGELRRAASGGWGQADPRSYFRIEGGLGLEPTAAANLVGLRLVARKRP
jgi:serine/threonine-protein kinase